MERWPVAAGLHYSAAARISGSSVTASWAAMAAMLRMSETCAFIGTTHKESIDRILELAALKREGRLGGIVVAGCMAQRYQADLIREIPEIDAVVGTGQVDAIARVAHRV